MCVAVRATFSRGLRFFVCMGMHLRCVCEQSGSKIQDGLAHEQETLTWREMLEMMTG